MDWWNDITDWIRSDDGWAVLTGAVFPFLAIVVAGVVGALLGRGATRRLVAQRDRESRAAAVASLITAGRSAATWHSLTPAAKEHSESLASAADIQVRLLPVSGAALAADWAAHQLESMRTNSVNFSFQADQTLDEYRDRLVGWLRKPGRAKKLFGDDLDAWKYDAGPNALSAEQQRWAEEQLVAETGAAPEHVPLLEPTTRD
ncbi:MAG: hypothetical protein R2717_03580 [Schumannella sp.]